jgi:hypothetical protein
MNTDVSPRIDSDVIRRVQGEFLEMPGIRLTARQAGRLLGLDERVCRRLLEALVETRFLRRCPLNQYTLVAEGGLERFKGAIGER